MRFIRTKNNQIELIEANDSKILSSIGLQLGEVYFQIKNKKVSFYLNDSEKPFDNFIWSLDIPITIDDVTYDSEDEASAALSAIMNNYLQSQIDEVKADLAEEIGRAQAAEEALDDTIDDETARAISAETHLQVEVTALSASTSALDARLTGVETDLSALTSTVNGEIARSTAKDAEHDALLSGLTSDLSALTSTVNDEITRSTSKDASQDALISGLSTSLQNEINRAVGAENSLRNDLNAEISARTSSDNSQDQRLTALEVGKADANSVYTKTETNALLGDKADKVNTVSTAVYNSTGKTIDFKNVSGTVIATIDARDFIKDGMVDNVEISGTSLVITFNTDAGKEPISIPLTDIFNPNNYYTKVEVNDIVSGINDSISTVSGDVITISGDIQTISGDIITISGDVLTTGDVQSQIDGSISGKTDLADFSAHTANTVVHTTQAEKDTWNAKSDFSGSYTDLTDKPTIPTVPTNVSAFVNDVPYLTEHQSLSGYATEAYVSGYTYSKGDVDGIVSGLNDSIDEKLDATAYTPTDLSQYWTSAQTTAYVSGFTYDKVTIDEKVAQGGTFDPTNYYDKHDIDNIVSGINDSIDEKYDASGITAYSTTVEVTNLIDAATSGKTDEADFSAHTANTQIHVTTAQTAAWDAKSDFSGSYTDLTDKPTIPTVPTNVSAFVNDVPYLTEHQSLSGYATEAWVSGFTYDQATIDQKVAGGGSFDPTQYYTKNDTNALLSGKTDETDFSGHTANTQIHVTTAQTAAWDAKSDFSGSYNDLTDKPTIPTVPTSNTAFTNDAGYITSAESQTLISQATSGLQETLSAGTNVTITNNVISATDTTYTAGDGIKIINNEIQTTTKFACLTEAAWEQISGMTDPNTIYLIH